ncbi:conserved repeat domain protein, partial [Vibrio parahaemolyticus VPTS-2010]
PRFSLKW